MKNISIVPQWKVYGDTTELQKPYDVSVVMPSIGRKEIIKAISSIYQQNVNRIQVLIGIDKPEESLLFLDKFLEECPKHISVNIFYPGYSTSVRHGGITPARDGGALRSTLTQLANSKYVAYLDDDNWWESTHLSDLLSAIQNKAWAFSLRYFVHPHSINKICIDEWESVGPGKGIFLEKFGGFVDPNCLIIDKELCWQCIPLWNFPLNDDAKGMSADRNIFNFLKNHSEPGTTGKASAYYVLDPDDELHSHRLSLIGEKYLSSAESHPSPQLSKWLSEGLLLHEIGNLTEAKDFYRKILVIKPDHCEALQLLGTIEIQTGNYAQAVEILTNALEIDPKHALTQNNLGVAFESLKQFEAAIDCYNRAIVLLPDYAEAYFNRGNTLMYQEQYSAAIESYNQAIFLVPSYSVAYVQKGLAYYTQGEFKAAIDSYDQSIAINPDYEIAHNDRGVVLLELKQFNAALSSFDEAIKLNPNYGAAHSNRGNALLELNNIKDAIDSFDKAIFIIPKFADAYFNRGNAYKKQSNFMAAIASYDKAIELNPNHANAYGNRGTALHHLRKIDAALASYEKAISINPNYVEALCDYALGCLLIGDFDKGWASMEWRWRHPHLPTFKERRYFHEPLWLGNESLMGKTILLYAEQGFGDTIMFSRYAKLVSDLGAKVILEVQSQLVSLLRNLEGISQILARGEVLPKFDYQTPLLSLPLAFHTNKNSIPSSTKYIDADPIKVAQWQVKLGEKLKPRIGLVWSGSEIYSHDANRSMQLNKLMPYLTTSVSWISLKNILGEVDRSILLNNSPILDFADELTDFSDTAALIECVDLVITVDTSVAHLSAALGKETWVLLPYTPDWRWQLDRDDSPWYPSMKLYRQPSIGDWASVLEKVKADLTAIY